METVKEIVMALLMSPAVQGAIVAGISYLFVNKLCKKYPKVGIFYVRYRGAMISAIKMAETEIPDDTQNKALHRLDRALQYTIQLIEVAENRTINDGAEIAKLKSDISAVHHEVLDAK